MSQGRLGALTATTVSASAVGPRCPWGSWASLCWAHRAHETLTTGIVVTVMIVTGLVHTVAVRPQSDRQERLIAQLNQLNAAQRSEFDRERGRLESRILQLDASLATVRARPDTGRPAGELPQIAGVELSVPIAPTLTRIQSSRGLDLTTTALLPKRVSPRLESSSSGQLTVSQTVQQSPTVNDAQHAGDKDAQSPTAPNDALSPTSDNVGKLLLRRKVTSLPLSWRR